MSTNIAIGEPTTVSYLRLIPNPDAAVTRPRLTRADLRIVGVVIAVDKAEVSAPQTWIENLVHDLRTNTCEGTISPGTNSRIRRYPSPQEQALARDLLAAQGVRFEINPYPHEDGSFTVRVEYNRSFIAGAGSLA